MPAAGSSYNPAQRPHDGKGIAVASDRWIRRHITWLLGEIPRWPAKGLVDERAARALAAHYGGELAARKPRVDPGILVLSIIGVLAVGAAVILFFAYNWRAMPRALKLAVLFGALAGAHIGGLAVLRGGSTRRWLAEALSFLGTMLFGAGIFLVAQIFHLDAHYPDGVLLWLAGALSMAWALPSVPQLILASALVAVWTGMDAAGGQRSILLFFPIAAIGVLPRIALSRAPAAAWAGIASILAGVAIVLFHEVEGFGFAVSPVVAAAFLASAGFCRGGAGATPLARPLRILGSAGFVLSVYILTFHEVVDETLVGAPRALLEEAVIFACFAGALAVGGLVFRPGRAGPRAERHLEAATVVTALALAAVALSAPWWGRIASQARFPRGTVPWAIAGLANVGLLGLGIGGIIVGARGERPELLWSGSLVILALLVARYFDLGENLLVRAALFLAAGALIVGVAVVLSRRRRANAGGGRPEGGS